MHRPQAPMPSAPAQAITRRRVILGALATLLVAGGSAGRAASDRVLVGTVDWLLGGGAVVVVHGRVEVVDRQLLGGVILDPGDGTDVRAGAPPTVAKRWGQKRVDDVLSRTRLP